jgi:tetratricopeptide (TPR) repeat protein
MSSIRHINKPSRPALATALAAVLLTGFAGVSQLASAESGSVGARADRSVGKAEQAVTANPQNAALRAALGRAYLSAGRFESAVGAYSDAMQLGETGSGAVLSLALAQIGAGRSGDAVALLDQWRDRIPAGDLGLALALGGETSRGVAILSEALRSGEDTPKLRQNLAYAYALDGRWSEARVMAAQDLQGDKLDARLSDWAAKGRSEDYRTRVAGLLQVPVRADGGQPAALALNGGSPVEAQAPVQLAAASGELKALDGTPGAEPAVAASEPDTVRFAEAFTPVEANQSRQPGSFVSEPVVQPIPSRNAAATPRRSRTPVQRVALTDSDAPVAAFQTAGLRPEQCTHLVQLGSFSSEANARRAWTTFSARNPELRSYRLTITPAKVKGRNFWRVAAAGLDSRRATGLCSAVKGRGGACFAYATTRPWPGAAPGGKSPGSGPMKARRK